MTLLVRLSSRYDGRLRGETTTPGQRTRPEVQKSLSDERRQYDSEGEAFTVQLSLDYVCPLEVGCSIDIWKPSIPMGDDFK